MPKVVWKFALATEHVQQIFMPKGAQILSIQVQYDQPVLWALCEPAQDQEAHVFVTVGTGQKFNHSDRAKYIGSYQMMHGHFIGHVFEV